MHCNSYYIENCLTDKAKSVAIGFLESLDVCNLYLKASSMLQTLELKCLKFDPLKLLRHDRVYVQLNGMLHIESMRAKFNCGYYVWCIRNKSKWVWTGQWFTIIACAMLTANISLNCKPNKSSLFYNFWSQSFSYSPHQLLWLCKHCIAHRCGRVATLDSMHAFCTGNALNSIAFNFWFFHVIKLGNAYTFCALRMNEFYSHTIIVCSFSALKHFIHGYRCRRWFLCLSQSNCQAISADCCYFHSMIADNRISVVE